MPERWHDIPHWGSTNIRCHTTKFSHPRGLASEICVHLWLHQDTLSYKGWRKVWQGGLHISRKDSYAGSSATTSRVRPHRPPWMGSMKHVPQQKGRVGFLCMGNPHYSSNPCYKILVLQVRWLGGGITILPCKMLLFKTQVSGCHGHKTGRTATGWKNALWLKWNT